MKQHEILPLIPVSRGEGVWLYDFDGHRYLDAISSWWVNLFGHCNPRINQAIIEQVGTIEHAMLAGMTHEGVIALSEQLSAIAPGQLGHCFYGSDGAAATEIALKMSFHYWQNSSRPGKRRFISLQNSYHGETVGALSVTDVAIFKDTYAPLVVAADQVPSPDWRLKDAGETAQDFAARCVQALEAYLQVHHDSIAAFIVEPLVQGAAGMGMYSPDYLRAARRLCDQYQVHLIADEIAVGMGRTGTMFACEQAGIAPDFMCLSKGITGGYLPLSVVLTTDDVYQAFYCDDVSRAFLHSHSYTGNALACSAALATLAIFRDDHVLDANRAKAALINEAAVPIARHPRVRNFRNTGMIWAFEVETSDPAFSRHFFQEALQRGVLLRPIGNTVYFMPPYIIDEAAIGQLIETVLDILARLPAGGSPLPQGGVA